MTDIQIAQQAVPLPIGDIAASCGIDPTFYNQRVRSFEEVLPWDHLDYGIRKEFLVRECKRARAGVTTKNCFEQCAGCGADRLDKEACHG